MDIVAHHPFVSVVRKNLAEFKAEPTFSLLGNEGSTHGGFAMLSAYLLKHPLLSSNDKVILQYLCYRAKSYKALASCRPTKSEAITSEIIHDLGLSRSTVSRCLNHLERLGLIVRLPYARESREAITLMPGPWPALGDRPEKGSTWQELFFSFRRHVKRWAQTVTDHPTVEAATEFLRGGTVPLSTPKVKEQKERSELLSSPKCVRKTHDETGSHCASKRHTAETPQLLLTPKQHKREKPSGTGENAVGLARARDRYINELNEGNEPNSSERGLEPRPPAARVDTQPGLCEQGSADREGRYVQGDLGSHSPQRQRKERLEAVVAGLQTDRVNPRSYGSNPTARWLRRYDRLLEECAGVAVQHGKKTRGQIRNAMKAYGPETMFDLLEWVFDNWDTLKANNPKLYGEDRYPPIKAFASYSLVNPILPYLKDGSALPVTSAKGGFHWGRYTAKQSKERKSLGISDEDLRDLRSKVYGERP